MQYMLDTNIASELIRNPKGQASRRARSVAGACCISIIAAAELRWGCARKGSPQLTARVATFLATIPVLPFDQPADERYGTIRTALEAAGTPIGSNDLLIAAHAHSLGATVVTANMREYSRVAGLKLENWLT